MQALRKEIAQYEQDIKDGKEEGSLEHFCFAEFADDMKSNDLELFPTYLHAYLR